MSDTRANIEITASTRRLAAGLGQARRMLGGFASAAARGVSGAFSKLKLGDTSKRALGNFGGDMMTRGFDAIVDTAQGVRDFERSLIRYQIATDGSAASTARMRAEVRAISRDTGIAAEEVLAGASQYVALTGDANGASRAMQFFADTAAATGTEVDDVAKASASLGMAMGISADNFENAFSGLVAQGKSGAVELTNLASEMPEVLSQFSAFRGAKSIEGVREMGAAFQVIRKNATSASSASTQFSALMGELADNEVLGKLQKIGVTVYDNTGKLRSASEIFEDLAKNQKLVDERVISAIFGRKEAQQAVRSIRDNIAQYRELKKVAKDTGVIQRDKMKFLESDAGRLDTAMNNLKVTIAEAFTPERIKAFTNGVEALVDKMGPLMDSIGWIGDKLGSLYSFGRSARGAFNAAMGNANANPWATGGIVGRRGFVRDVDVVNATGQVPTADGFVDRNSPEGRAAIEAAKRRIASRRGFDQTAADIMAGESNERTTPESVRRAVIARFNANEGTATAGNRYLASAFGSGEEVSQAVDRVVRQIAVEMGKAAVQDAKRYGDAIVGALSGLTFNIGRDKVVDAVNNSSQVRTSTRP